MCNMTVATKSTPKEARALLRDTASAGVPEPQNEAKTAESVRERRREAARRALAEAQERILERRSSPLQVDEAGKHERFGRGGLDPVRYGDWEVKGIATDF